MAFNPSTSFSGNGAGGQLTVNYSTTATTWAITTLNLLGTVSVGTFPNTQNSNSIASQSFNFTWPVRGGKTIAATIKPATGGSTPIGITSVGIILYGPSSGINVNGLNNTAWTLNAVEAGIQGEDLYGGTVTSSGAYNYKDGRFVSNNAWGTITDSTWEAGYRSQDGHSKIIGWARDGYPIYGPYGYSSALNTASTVIRMVSGFYPVNKANRPPTKTLIVNGTVTSSTQVLVYSAAGLGLGMSVTGGGLPNDVRIMKIVGVQITLNKTVNIPSGTALTASFPLGIFMEDWAWSNTTGVTLDVYNGRFCRTPEYPEGTYAYFLSETSTGVPYFPYIVGLNFHGPITADNNNITLSNLTVSSGTLSPAFNSNVLNYNLTITNTVSSVSFTPSVSTNTSFIKVNTTTVISGTTGPVIPLIVGLTTATISVSSQYQTTGTYSITIDRLKSSNNNLSSLLVSPSSLSPVFTPTVTSYTIVVTETDTNLYIVPTVANSFATVKVNTSTVISGQIRIVPLSFGYNNISVEVTAQDGTTKTYYITAIRLSNVSLLTNLSVSTGTLTPSFNKNTFYYNVTIPNSITSISLTGTVIDSGSQLYFNGVLTPSGQQYTLSGLSTGVNVITGKIKSSDNTTEHNYRVNVLRDLSSNADLSLLTFAEGSLIPSFSSSTVAYSALVNNDIKTISITANTWDASAGLSINGATTLSGASSQPIPILVGTTSIPIRVTSPNSTVQKTYTLTITRKGSSVSTLSNVIVFGGTLTPAFNSSITQYNLPIGYRTTGVKIRPFSSDPTSTITINNVNILSGTTSTNIPTSVGTASTITIKVISQNQESTTTYTINALRESNYDNNLSYLIPGEGTLFPAFNAEITSYSYTVSGTSVNTEITAFTNDQTAQLLINNVPATSGVARLVPLSGNYNNGVWNGLNVITVKVIAANPIYQKTYTLNVTKLASGVSTLDNLVVDPGSFTPVFNSNTYEYYLNLPYVTDQIRIKADPTDIYSTILMNNNFIVQPGTYSPYFRVYVGNQNIPVVVESPSKETITGYNIFINRAGIGSSTDAYLLNLIPDIGILKPAFNKNVYNYTLSVSGSATKYRISPYKSNNESTVRINGNTVLSGEYSSYINLPNPVTTSTIRVTAGDNATIQNYTVTVVKEKSSNSYLSNIILSNGKLTSLFTSTKTDYTIELPFYVKAISIKPFTADSQSRMGVQRLLVTSGTWSQPVLTPPGTTTVVIDVTAGDQISQTLYKFNVIRSNAVLTNPANLFLQNSQNTVYANLLNKNSLRIISKGRTTYVASDTFPNSYIRFPVLDQKIDVIYPYRGGEQVPAEVPIYRDATTNTVGITVVGIPIRNPRSTTVSGLNSSTWSLDANFNIKTMPRDPYSGGPDNTGAYYYLNDKFVTNNAWANTQGWLGDYTHDDGHSRVIGFAADGYPIYGPYGYAYPTSSLGGVKQMTSGYTTRILPNRPPSVEVRTQFFADSNTILLQSITGLQVGMRIFANGLAKELDTTILQINTTTIVVDRSVSISIDIPITAYWPNGAFVEDYVYSITTATLDIHNGRYCVTPEYPIGTYAYFMTTKNGVPAYPYVIGNTFFGNLSDQVVTNTVKPTWVTTQGLLPVVTELLPASITLSATGPNIRYQLINGSLPGGLTLNTSTGVISGVPTVVWLTDRSEFVIRAYNQYGVVDRSFMIDVLGPTPPRFITPGIRPAVGPSGEKYLINGQIVDFQFTATTDILGPGREITYHIADGDGQLPPGLVLTTNGHLYGQVKDNLTLFYQLASNGAFDEQGWDAAPFEHVSLQAIGSGPRFINKTYQFIITASNAAGTARQLYQIDVNDPSSDISKYPVAPQWLTPSDLGSIRANTKQVIQFEIHDCDPGTGNITFDWEEVNEDLPVLPQDMVLDKISGTMSGYLRYTPVYSSVYSFKVRVLKTSPTTGIITFRDKNFTITIQGATISKMKFITDSNVGTLYQGQQSELSILALHDDPNIKVRYSLQSGSLPPGIGLTQDGALAGVVPYNTATTVATTYSFNVLAIDSNLGSQLVKNFKVQVLPYQGQKYTKILLHPLLSIKDRLYWDTFINDPSVFDFSLLYRPYDPAFGVQKVLEFVLEWGVQELYIAQYVNSLQNYFYRKRLYFGELKSAFATDDNGDKLYEVVYVELIDNLVNDSGVPINPVVQYGDTTIYPNSIDSMRGAIESIALPTDDLLPKFMRTVQDNTGVPLGRIICLPLCYCLPGNSQLIIRKIETYGIDFKLITFDLDRITVLNTKDNSSAKYLLFPKRGFLT